MKILVTKAVSQDEQLQMTVEGKDAQDIRPKLHAALELLDARLLQQSMRVVDALKETEGLPPVVRQCINATMGVLFGRPGALQELAVAKEHLVAEGKMLPASQGELRVVDATDVSADTPAVVSVDV